MDKLKREAYEKAFIAIQRDAVISFAERLKEQAFECDISFGLGLQHIRQAVAVDDIDNLVAEMFGNPEQKGEENAEIKYC